MIEILINDIEQAMLNTLNNEQLSQLRKVLEYTFRNVRVTENEQSNAKESNSELVTSFISSKSVEGHQQCAHEDRQEDFACHYR